MDNNQKFLKIMEENLVPSLGCTEPIAVAYVAAVARDHAEGEIKELLCEASVNIVKNAASVCIPNTDGRCGVALAAAVGAVGGVSAKGLEVLADLNKDQVAQAVKLVESGIATAAVSENPSKLYVKIKLKTEKDTVITAIDNGHTNLVYVEKNGEVLLDKSVSAADDKSEHDDLYSILNLQSIYEYGNTAPLEDLKLPKLAIELQTAICAEGLKNGYGIQVGKTMKEMVDKGYIAYDMASNAAMWAAAGSDARMAGCSLAAMSNVGSGNQGITNLMPVIATAKYLNIESEEKLIRAVTVAALVTIYVKSSLDKLSPVCGAVTAAVGAGCGIVYLMDGTVEMMEMVVKNVIGDVAGMFCDGAKGSCALKVSTCVNAGVHAALLALNGHYAQYTDGVVGVDAAQTVSNFARLSKEGMNAIDGVILDIILKKEQ